MFTKFTLMFFAFSAFAPLAVAQSPIIGVLEDVPGVYAGQANAREVRVVFEKVDHRWIAFPSNCPDQNCLKSVSLKYPRQVTWNIGFDGRLLGQATGQTPNGFDFYSHVGLQKITTGTPIPTVGQRSEEFGGYIGASVYRPLVASSEPYFNDPDKWKASQLTPAETQLFRRQFRQKFPKLCKSGEDETKLEAFLFRDEDIQAVKAYTSRKGWKMARLHLEGASACDDGEAGFQIDDPWFAVDPRDRVDYLGSGMWLVDAGDYDNNGNSELVFSIDRDNRGGYLLFYDDFSHRAVFEFSYH
jgi:hypothetical protein